MASIYYPYVSGDVDLVQLSRTILKNGGNKIRGEDIIYLLQSAENRRRAIGQAAQTHNFSRIIGQGQVWDAIGKVQGAASDGTWIDHSITVESSRICENPGPTSSRDRLTPGGFFAASGLLQTFDEIEPTTSIIDRDPIITAEQNLAKMTLICNNRFEGFMTCQVLAGRSLPWGYKCKHQVTTKTWDGTTTVDVVDLKDFERSWSSTTDSDGRTFTQDTTVTAWQTYDSYLSRTYESTNLAFSMSGNFWSDFYVAVCLNGWVYRQDKDYTKTPVEIVLDESRRFWLLLVFPLSLSNNKITPTDVNSKISQALLHHGIDTTEPPHSEGHETSVYVGLRCDAQFCSIIRMGSTL